MWHDKIFRSACGLTIVFPVLLLSTAMADIALCTIAVLFLVHCYMQKDWGWCKEGWAQVLAMLWLYMNLRGIGAEHAKEALSRSLPFGRYIVFAAALARWTLADTVTRQRFLNVLAGFVIVSALDGLLQYVAGYDLLLHPLIHDPGAGHIRLDGPFTKPILGIMLAWLAFPALLPALFKKEPSAKKHYLLGLIACAAVVLAAIALSGERMALLLTLLGIAMACVLLRLRLRIIALGAAFIAGLLVVLAFASPDMLERQVSSTIQTLTHWQESPYGLLLTSDMTLAKQHPIFGMGAGNFRSGCEALYIGDQESATRITQMCNTHPHNIYLEWLIEEGIIGFALFVIFIGLVIKNCVCVFIRQPVNLAFSGLFIAFILRLWPLMATTGFFSRWGAPPFWLVLGGLLVYTAGKGVKNAGASLSLQDTRL